MTTSIRTYAYTALILLTLIVLSTGAHAACGNAGAQLSRWYGIAIERCSRQDVTLSFDGSKGVVIRRQQGGSDRW